ncbi:MAG TPA: hypothetical protein VK438_07330 [Xanthobacteraceae bacterium]|nr:hypothetical protein [Xanthobacteraceae bacterium]
MVTRVQTRTRARFTCRGVCAALIALCAAACSETTSSNAALTSGASGPTIAFDSIDGPPVAVFNRLVDHISAEAQQHQIAVASREGAANYRVRGYLAAQVVRGRTLISWVWDVYDDVKIRALRIRGEEAGGRGGADPWSVADDAMLRRIARLSMDRLAAFLRNPDAPAEPDAALAEVDDGAPQRQPARRPHSASAAEQLALSASR